MLCRLWFENREPANVKREKLINFVHRLRLPCNLYLVTCNPVTAASYS
jgi:hypothetical protein